MKHQLAKPAAAAAANATERRTKRSTRKDEALRLLLEAVRKRSVVSSIAIVDSRGLVVAGAGSQRELAVLGAVAAPAAKGTFDVASERLTEGTDVMSCPLTGIGGVGEGNLYLAALGERVSRMADAARGVKRILS